MKALFDTNILIDFLLGEQQAKAELSRYDQRLISIVTWVEVMVGVQTPEDQSRCRDFLAEFSIIDFDLTIANRTVEIRKKHRIKLPDAIIWASAMENGALLVTRNSRDFPTSDPFVRIPYSLTV